jgi:hypothetical protein
MEESLEAIDRSVKLMRAMSDAVSAMRGYRIYLLDADQSILAAETFTTAKDDEAARIARLIYVASSDVFVGYELWRGEKRIFSLQKAGLEATGIHRLLDARAEKDQEIAVDLEERLQAAFACAARSRKLVEAAKKLRMAMANARLASVEQPGTAIATRDDAARSAMTAGR